MIKAVIYNSGTGFTEEYANLISEELNIPKFNIKDLKLLSKNLKANDEVLYLGWVCAGKIVGLSKIRKKYNIVCCGSVGAYPENNKNIEELKKANNIYNFPLFYLRGGINISKLGFWKKKLLNMVADGLSKENNEETKELINVLKNGGSFVKKENTENLLSYLKNSN